MYSTKLLFTAVIFSGISQFCSSNDNRMSGELESAEAVNTVDDTQDTAAMFTSGPAGKEFCDTINIETDSSSTSEQPPVSPESEEMPDTMTIALCGDIMMGTTFPEVELPANDGRDLFKDTKPITQRADLALGNLEGALCDDGKSRKGSGPNTYSFRTPTNYAVNLSDAGYDFLSVANNHSLDFGEHGMDMTEQSLKGQDISYAGVKGRSEYAIVERNGVKYGICAFGHNPYTVMHTNLTTVKRILDTLRPQCDILVVSFHGGAEGADQNHLPEGTETFLGENRGNLREFTHFCIDNGADVIYGHGPHVTRCMEVYKNKFIVYSLGNFCTPYGMSLIGIKGYAPVVEIKIDRNGDFISGQIHSFIQKKGIGPLKDSTNSVAKEMKSLSESDIKNPQITISTNGEIRRISK